jgi:hypothetical protein
MTARVARLSLKPALCGIAALLNDHVEASAFQRISEVHADDRLVFNNECEAEATVRAII